MPICRNCGEKWTWVQTMIAGFSLATGLKCPHCATIQYLTSESKKRMGLSVFLVPLTLFIPITFNISYVTALIILVVIGLLVVSFFPVMAKLSNTH